MLSRGEADQRSRELRSLKPRRTYKYGELGPGHRSAVQFIGTGSARALAAAAGRARLLPQRQAGESLLLAVLLWESARPGVRVPRRLRRRRAARPVEAEDGAVLACTKGARGEWGGGVTGREQGMRAH